MKFRTSIAQLDYLKIMRDLSRNYQVADYVRNASASEIKAGAPILLKGDLYCPVCDKSFPDHKCNCPPSKYRTYVKNITVIPVTNPAPDWR